MKTKCMQAALLCIVLLLAPIVTFAFDFKKADELFDKGTFQEALGEYESVFAQSKDTDEHWKSFFRICESLAHLYRYGEAAQKLLAIQLPDELTYRSRVLILKAEILRNFLQQYSNFQRGDVIDDDKQKEVFRLTPEEIKTEIDKCYRQLWDMRSTVSGMDIKKEEYFLDIKNVDFGMYPVFFDYFIFSWTDYLLGSVPNKVVDKDTRPDADIILTEDFKLPINFKDSAGLLAAEIMEEASRLDRRSQPEASERWRIKRILLPTRYMHCFIFKNEKGYLDYRKRVKDILMQWMRTFKTEEARAEAGYEAALISRYLDQAKEAVQICLLIEKLFPKTHTKTHAEVLRSQIQMPQFYLQVQPNELLQPEKVSITTSNLKEVHFRLFRIDPRKLKENAFSSSNPNSFNGWSQMFRYSYPFPEWFKGYLAREIAFKEWSMPTLDKADYKVITNPVNLPKLDLGMYLLFACGDRDFKTGSSLLNACIINLTDFALISTSGVTQKTLKAYYNFIDLPGYPADTEDDVFRFYTLNSQTGKPESNVSLDAYAYNSSGGKRDNFILKSNGQGVSTLSFPVNVQPQGYNNYYVDPLAYRDKSFAYLNNQLSLYYSAPSPLELFIETDRPIYRPGDKVQAKVVVTRRIPQGFKTLNSQYKVEFVAKDHNYKDFFTQELNLNESGSASVSFALPSGKLLGRYTLSATCYDGRFRNTSMVYFSVEEYKRPEFEIVLKPAAEPWKYGQPVEIKGEAKYYFGGPVPDAPVTYRIKRQIYIPFMYRCWFGQNTFYFGSQDEIASGKLKTDKEGNFALPFTPAAPPAHQYADKIPEICAFTVEIEARDAGGRTIESSQVYKAGKSGIYFTIIPKKGFYLENDAIDIESNRLTINDTPAQGKSNYEVFLLLDAFPKQANETRQFGWYGYIPPLDVQLKDIGNGKLMKSGEVEHDKDGKALIRISSLPQGTYRIVQKTLDAWGQEVKQDTIFVVAKARKSAVPLKALSVTLAEKDEYEVGQTARFLIGSGFGSGVYYLELWAGTYFLRSQLLDTDLPVQVLEIPVTPEMKGGFTLRWFGVKNSDVRHGQATVSVPWKEKKLNITFEPFTKELFPGKQVSWGLKVTDKDKKPQTAEILALMYDRSLEYYISSDNRWLDTLYLLQRPLDYGYAVDSLFPPQIFSIPITEGLWEKMLRAFSHPPEDLRAPTIRIWRAWAHGYGYLGYDGGGFGGAVADFELPREASLSAVNAPMLLAEGKVKAERGFKKSVDNFRGLDKAEEISQQAQVVETRKAFADTAFFNPHIITALDGKANFTFKAPEQLTSWRIKAFAFTNDVKEGTASEEAVTKKDLMARVDIPRFFREKDLGTITAVVHNEGDIKLKGSLSIDVTENSLSVKDKLKLTDNKKEFILEPHSLKSFDWMIEIPEGVTNYKVRVQAIAGGLSDAEERDLPILPSRQRLIESALVSLQGNTIKKLQISLPDDPTRINESMVLQIDPQLFLTIMNTIPFLIEYPHECVEQILNKYVPLSIINQVYKKYPDVQKAVSKIPERTTVTPAWEKDDPNRLMKLMETPWVWQSEGRPTIWPIIDMLNPETVKNKEEENLGKLRAAQLSNGAFPWWPGGRADPYMTLYVLAGFAEARRYGVNVPSDMIAKALDYVNREIPLKLKPEDRDLCLVSYAAYVVTSFSPREFRQAKSGFEAAKAWVVFLEENIHALTPFGKAYLAFTYLRLGNKTRANEVLNMALDGAREDPIAGVYWTPEKYSWVWYSDTVEKHAFLLRTLQELRPEDKLIPGMVQWLIFSRKGTVWKSTKASVAAIYALLDYLNQKGALASDENFKIKWGKTQDSLTLKADDWLDKPIRWQEKGFEITPDMSSATIEKDGPGIAFASLTWTYSTDQLPVESAPGMLELKRSFYRRVKEGDNYHLKLLKSNEKVLVGDQIEVQLKMNTRSQFEYMHLKDPKPSGFEAETLLSGWKYDPLWFYEEPRDSLTNFFLDWLPHGEYILRYRLRPTKPGIYRVGAATLQSMYSPEMTAHSDGFIVEVVKE